MAKQTNEKDMMKDIAKNLVYAFSEIAGPIIRNFKDVKKLLKEYEGQADQSLLVADIASEFLSDVFDSDKTCKMLPEEIAALSDEIWDFIFELQNEIEEHLKEKLDWDEWSEKVFDIVNNNFETFFYMFKDILDQRMKANKKEPANKPKASSKKENDTKTNLEWDRAVEITAVYIHILMDIVKKEDDVTELCEKYSELDEASIQELISLNVILALFDGEEDEMFKNVLKLVGQRNSVLQKEMIKQINDVESFKVDFAEVFDDHHKEFIKKFHKNFKKLVEERKK